jgi:hypothetical protein
MNLRRSMHLGVPLIALVLTGSMALAQEQSQQAPTADHSAHHGATDQQTDQQMGQQTGQQMMGGCPMMGGMMGQGKGGMMQGGMGPGMMQGGMGGMFGSRVTPMMNLSAEDVRGYLGAQLDRLGNTRLKVGDIKAEDGSITADIVTVDNSLVQRLKVDRHTGAIEYQN